MSSDSDEPQMVVDWPEQVERLARVAASEAAQVMRDLRTQRQAGRPAAADKLAGAAERLARASSSWQRTAAQMREAERAMAEHQARLSVEHADLLRDVIAGVFDAAGLEVDGALRGVLGGLLRAATSGEQLAVPVADAEQLRAEVRDRVARQLIERGDVKPRAQGPRLLGAGAPPHPDGRDREERNEMVGPRTTVRTVGERNVVEGQVVEESSGPVHTARKAGRRGGRPLVRGATGDGQRKIVWREIGELEL